MRETFYNARKFLNTEESPSTGSVCCFDGMTTYDDDKRFRNIFCSVSDCHVSARLHKTDDDTIEDFIAKMKILHREIGDFISHLEEKQKLDRLREVPEDKKAERVDGILTLVDEPEKPHEFKVGDKAILKNDTGFSQRNGVCLISAGTQVEIMSVSNCINDTDKLYEVKYQNATTVVKRGDIIPIEQKSIEYKFKVGDKVTDSYYQDTIYEIVDLKEYDGEPLYVLKLNDAVFIALERCIKLVPQDIAERIKTFDDAEDWCSQNKPELCRQWRDYCNAEDDDVEAYLKLRIITAALNEGWKPTFEEPEYMTAFSKTANRKLSFQLQ